MQFTKTRKVFGKGRYFEMAMEKIGILFAKILKFSKVDII